jgi:hypothetical protein
VPDGASPSGSTPSGSRLYGPRTGPYTSSERTPAFVPNRKIPLSRKTSRGRIGQDKALHPGDHFSRRWSLQGNGGSDLPRPILDSWGAGLAARMPSHKCCPPLEPLVLINGPGAGSGPYSS